MSDLFDKFPTRVMVRRARDGMGLVIDYSIKGFGFGQMALVVKDDGTFYVDRDGNSPERIMEILKMAVDSSPESE